MRHHRHLEAVHARAARYERLRRRVVAPYRGWLARVAWCESTNNPRAVDPSGTYTGLYQFDDRSWHAAGGKTARAMFAGRLEQSYRAVIWLRMTGPGSWPVCSRR